MNTCVVVAVVVVVVTAVTTTTNNDDDADNDDEDDKQKKEKRDRVVAVPLPLLAGGTPDAKVEEKDEGQSDGSDLFFLKNICIFL